MKIIGLVSIMIFFLIANASVVSETAPRTTADMYLESIASVLPPNPADYTLAEYRAAQYRAMYERCDQDHNCTSETAGESKETARKKGETRLLIEEQSVAGRFPHTVILQ